MGLIDSFCGSDRKQSDGFALEVKLASADTEQAGRARMALAAVGPAVAQDFFVEWQLTPPSPYEPAEDSLSFG
jgi:hypothetical protein